jgi:hypothetical protein
MFTNPFNTLKGENHAIPFIPQALTSQLVVNGSTTLAAPSESISERLGSLLQAETDLQRHLDYIHYRPVKHKLVVCPKDYPFSSFHRYLRAGVYELNWACHEPLDFTDVARTVGE